MANVALQVGLYQATFSGNTGTVAFDDFSLSVVPEPATMVLLGLGGMGILGKNSYCNGLEGNQVF